ncbi:MAG: TetR/AcrR family transcriptional regulator [Bacteroidota bacterium]
MLNNRAKRCFFYRDILEICQLVPDAKDIYVKQMKQVVNFSKNGMYLAIGKGLVKAEPHEGAYRFFAKNVWAILNSWLIEREVLGEEKVSLHEVMVAIWEFHLPALTEKGEVIFTELKKQLPKLIQEEIKNSAQLQ